MNSCLTHLLLHQLRIAEHSQKYPLRPRQPLAVLSLLHHLIALFSLQPFFAVDFGLLCGIRVAY